MINYQLSQKNNFSNVRRLGNVQFWVLGLVTLFCLGLTTTSYAQKKKRNKKHILPYLKDIKTAEEIAEIFNKFDRFKYQILGHFSNKDQVAAGTTTEDSISESIIDDIFFGEGYFGGMDDPMEGSSMSIMLSLGFGIESIDS